MSSKFQITATGESHLLFQIRLCLSPCGRQTQGTQGWRQRDKLGGFSRSLGQKPKPGLEKKRMD